MDGQHRLAGIIEALAQAPTRDWYDEIPVIFVAHRNDDDGLVRTRRLFTTLNKNARPVSKRDTIALDEDDVMAITVRRFIEQEPELFGEDRIALVAENNMPPGDETSLTTIGNLYDVLAILFSKAKTDLKKPKKMLQKKRPSDDELDAYFELAQRFFVEMRRNFGELDTYFSTDQMHSRSWHATVLMAAVFSFARQALTYFRQSWLASPRDMPLEDAIQVASRLPRALGDVPFVDLVWDSSSNTIKRFSKPTVRELLLHMLGKSNMASDDLLAKYRRELGKPEQELPDSVV